MNQFNFPGLTLMKAVATAESIQDEDQQNLFMSSLTQDCDLYHRVATVMYFFGQLVKDRQPGFQEDQDLLILRMKLITEEFVELWEKGLGIKCDIVFDLPGAHEPIDDHEFSCMNMTRDIEVAIRQSDPAKWNFVEFADALGDIKVVTEGTNIAFGIPAPLVDWEIHCSNMTKLNDGGVAARNGITDGFLEGQPGYHPDKPLGKWIKGPHYVEADIASILGLGDSN